MSVTKRFVRSIRTVSKQTAKLRILHRFIFQNIANKNTLYYIHNKSTKSHLRKLSQYKHAATLLTICFTGITAILYVNQLNVPQNQIDSNSQKQKKVLDINKPLYVQQTEMVHVHEAKADITYDLSHSFSSTINGIKMMQLPLPQILCELLIEYDLNTLYKVSSNLFAERTITDHKLIECKEYIRFHDTLKPFKWLEHISILNYISNICITANEYWIIDWKQNKAECLIQNESLRWTFSVDELIIIQQSNTSNSQLHKVLFVNTFIPVPNFMYSKYKTSSDCCMDCIEKLAVIYASNHYP